MIKSNFHTHSTFCDGKNTVQEMIAAAAEKGMVSLGLSSHAMYPFASSWHMAPADYEAYTQEIARLKEAFAAQIEVFTGFEADFFPLLSVPDKAQYSRFSPDYIIGSVHYLPFDVHKNAVPVDGSSDDVALGLEQCFGGNGRKMAECYFEAVRTMARDCSFDIVGHADLIRIRNGALKFFSEDSSWYKAELVRTARAIGDSHRMAEINTGGIARNAIDDVYPSADFLKALHDCCVPIVINSDAHRARDVDFGYELALLKAKDAGYTETYRLTRKNGAPEWVPVPIGE